MDSGTWLASEKKSDWDKMIFFNVATPVRKYKQVQFFPNELIIIFV